MPFKSKSQVRKCGALMKEGKISESTFDEFASSTKSIKKLPEKVKKGKKR